MGAMPDGPRALVLMGVAGSGKTVVGGKAAQQLGWEFLDADDYHPPANVEKMHRGEPLNDADRKPWLERLHEELQKHLAAGKSVILACSALKDAYRKIIKNHLGGVEFVYLHVDHVVVAERLAKRTQHFFPKELLDSQFETLETPSDAIEINANLEIDQVVAEVVAQGRSDTGVK
jgi:gluconokinase